MERRNAKAASRIGPSPCWILHLVVLNPLTYAAMGLSVFGGIRTVRSALYVETVRFPSVQRAYLVLYQWLESGSGWACVGALFAIPFIIGTLLWLSHSYKMDAFYVYKTTGLLGIYEDPISLAQVADCDRTRNLFQRVFGSGCLILKVLDQGGRIVRPVRLYYVGKDEAVREVILANCGGKSARIIL